MKKEMRPHPDQKQTVALAALSAILLNILVTKLMLLFGPAVDAQKDASMINKVYMAVLVAGSALLLWKSPMTFRLDALKPGTGKCFRREMLEAGAVSLVLITGMLVWRAVLNTKDPAAAARPVFGLYPFIHGRWFYPVSAVLQEFFIKGVVQENFRSLSPAGSRHYTVIMTGMFFAALHANYPLYYLLGAGLLCVGTGYLYERDRNIWGSALIHFVIGFMPRALGLK